MSNSATIAGGVSTILTPLRFIVFLALSFALRITLRSFFDMPLVILPTVFWSSAEIFLIDVDRATVAPIAKLIGIEVMNLTFVYHCSATAATGEP